MGIPAWDNLNQIPAPIRKGVQVHLVTDTNEHTQAAISEVANEAAGEVMLQIDDPTRTYGRYTTPAHHDEVTKAVGSWHYIER